MKNHCRRAFTLIEVIIACVIFSLILESIYVTLNVGQKSWNRYSNDVLIKQEVRRALITMSSELREARNVFIVKDDDHHGVTINFERSPWGVVSYSWSDEGDNAYKIIRTNNDHSKVLASRINLLSFDYPVDNQIIINVAAGKENMFNLKEEVTLRLKTNPFVHS